MVVIVTNATSEPGLSFSSAVERVIQMTESSTSNDTVRISFDCEGVNLSRIGTIELISICFPWMDVYLIDMNGTPDPNIVAAVKQIMEHEKIVKIIHDCRMDSDALYHLHGIKLTNVHDTSCFHAIITNQEDKSLNDVLQYNGMNQNVVRDKGIYRTNPHFWATRPVSSKMITWATGDVDQLFGLAEKQLDRIGCNETNKKERGYHRSNEFAATARDMKIATGLRVRNPGRFIGPGGSNLRNVQHRTGTIMYQEHPKSTWFVYYSNSAALDTVRRSMEN